MGCGWRKSWPPFRGNAAIIIPPDRRSKPPASSTASLGPGFDILSVQGWAEPGHGVLNIMPWLADVAVAPADCIQDALADWLKRYGANAAQVGTLSSQTVGIG